MVIINFNVGILGHVDSGKTSLAKALSSVASTACFDKNPQSKERGITLDLGFSSFAIDIPAHLKNEIPQESSKLQFTLVDCPGHASLIKTIIGGAQIIDLMLLVIDVTKGIQTQTAECLVIGEITCNKMIVVLNKIDLIPPENLKGSIDKISKRIQQVLKNTKFLDSPIIPVSVLPETENSMFRGIPDLVDLLTKSVFIPNRQSSGSFLFSVDHCFPIKGQGTVMTGTVLSGKVSVNDTIEIPILKLTRKVKSMQMFRQSIDNAYQGDRLGICVTQFDSKLLERGLACTPGYLPTAYAVIINLEKIRYFKHSIKDKSKYHVTFGHVTVMARLHLFYSKSESELNFDTEYEHWPEVIEITNGNVFAVLELDHPISVVPESLVIGSKFDTDIQSSSCRIAFKGNVLHVFEDENYFKEKLPALKVFKIKQKDGLVERMSSPYEVIVKNLLKKESNVQPFVNLAVSFSTGENGIIEGHFGQSGKVKIRIRDGLNSETQALLTNLAKKKTTETTLTGNKIQVTVQLLFKRYIYDPHRKIIQT